MKIGFTAGTFDLTHFGHVLMLEECKQVCDYLIVGVQLDPSVDRPHKNKPVQSMEERMGIIKAIRWVDEVVTYTTEASLVELIKKIKPDIRIVGSDWKEKSFSGDDLPIEIYFNSRDHNYSSSNLRKRVVEAEAKIKHYVIPTTPPVIPTTPPVIPTTPPVIPTTPPVIPTEVEGS